MDLIFMVRLYNFEGKVENKLIYPSFIILIQFSHFIKSTVLPPALSPPPPSHFFLLTLHLPLWASAVAQVGQTSFPEEKLTSDADASRVSQRE